MEIPVCHLESGLRRYDMRVQEEMNRRLIDHGSSALFTPTSVAAENLQAEMVQGIIYTIGDTMYDILLRRSQIFLEPNFQEEVLSKHEVSPGNYAVLTWHRREHVDDKKNLTEVVKDLGDLESLFTKTIF